MDFEEKTKMKIQKRRVTIATESPANELSPHYATKLEKQAFKKIKEWKKGFALQLDQVLQQHQFISQHSDNKANVNKAYFTSDSPCPAPHFDVNSQTIPSPPHATKLKPAPQALEQDAQGQLITELRGLSEMSVSGMNDVSNADKGSRILQEIKKKRKHSKLGENKKMMEDCWHKKETRRSTDDLSSTSDSHDVNRALKHCKHRKGLGADEKLIEDLSSWHKQETGKIANDLCSNTSDSQEVTRLLTSLKETIDAIFITTIQRASEFVGVSSTSKENNLNTDHDSPDQAALLMQIKNTQEERDSLHLQNITLQNEIVDLKSRLAEASEEKVGGDAVDLNSIHEQTGLESYVRIQEVQRVISRLKEFAGSEKQADRILPDDGKKYILLCHM